MQGKFSYAPLHALLEAGIQVCAVVIPAEQVFEVELPAIQKHEQPSISRSMLPVLNSSIHSSILRSGKGTKYTCVEGSATIQSGYYQGIDSISTRYDLCSLFFKAYTS